MFTYNILIYQFEPEPLILRGFPALLIHLSVENGKKLRQDKGSQFNNYLTFFIIVTSESVNC